MKGIVFSEFIEMVEDKFGIEIADTIIEHSNLPNSGAYTQVGTYDHNELVTLVKHLSAETGIAFEALVQAFGEHLLIRFTQMYPVFFTNVSSCFAFLDTIENRVHVEVKKLYPDAELPSFKSKIEGNRMQMLYTSKRPFSALAYGLIIGSANYYGEKIAIKMIDESDHSLTKVRFELTHL